MSDEPFKNAIVLINTVNVNSYLVSLEINEIRNGIRTATVAFDHEITNFITIKNGLVVDIAFKYNDETTTHKKFYGFINNVQDAINGMIIQCVDPLWKCTGETLTKVYKESDSFGGEPTKILIDLYGYVDLTADATTIDPTPVTLPEITCDSAHISEKTSSIISAIGFDEYYNPEDNKVYVSNSDLYTTYVTQMEVGSNVINFPDYNDNIFQTINEIELQGVSSDSAYKQSFTGDGTTTVFTLDRTPLSTYIYVTVNGTEQKGSVDGASTTYDYLINKQQGFITFKTAPAGSASIVVNYTATELTSVTVDDEDSQDENTKRKIVIAVSDAITVDDALERANNMIKVSKNNFYNFNVNVINVLDLSCRNLVNYSDSSANIFLNGLYVNSVKWKWPEYYDEVNLGTKPFNVNELLYNTEERVKKLERKRQEGQVLTINKISSGSQKVYLDSLNIEKITHGSSPYGAIGGTTGLTANEYSGSNGHWDCSVFNKATATVTLPDEVYGDAWFAGSQLTLLKNNDITGIKFSFSYNITGTGDPEVLEATLLMDGQKVGSANDIVVYSGSHFINIGGISDMFGLQLNALDFEKPNFGLSVKFKNNATSLTIDTLALIIVYIKNIVVTTTVSDTKKYVKSDYDAGTVDTVSEVTYTDNIDNTLQITGVPE